MSRPSLVLLAFLGMSGCMTRSSESSSTSALVEPQPEYAWDMAVCDVPQANGHCDLRDGVSETEVDMSDNAFYVTVRSIGRGDVPVVIRLHKQRRNTFDGSSVGTSGRRVRVSPTYQLDAGNARVTHKFEFTEGVLQNGLSYVVIATSNEDELYATITTTGAPEPLQDGEGMDVPADAEDDAPSEP